jgi:hypothetical protein
VAEYLATDEARWIKQGLDKEWLLKQFVDSVAADAHGSCEQVFERERSSAIVAERWAKGNTFVEVPLDLPELPPGPGLKKTYEAWLAAKESGRAVTEEDNMAAMGIGGREAALMGGYEVLRKEAPPEKLARLSPEYPPPSVSRRCACDPNILAGLCVHKAGQPDFHILGDNERRVDRHITVVAATHGSGVSRLARRFNQRQVARYDRVAKAWAGKDAYHRPTDVPTADRQKWESVAELVASKLASGAKPQLKVLLTHEHPTMIVDKLKRAGISANWILYSPDRAEAARRVAARNVNRGILLYMQASWNALYKEKSPACELITEEEVIQMVQVEV